MGFSVSGAQQDTTVLKKMLIVLLCLGLCSAVNVVCIRLEEHALTDVLFLRKMLVGAEKQTAK